MNYSFRLFQGLEVDYSMESHAKDHERFINVARYAKLNVAEGMGRVSCFGW